MKSKEENNQSTKSPLSNANGQEGKVFSLMASYASPDTLNVKIPNNNNKLSTQNSPEYNLEGEEGSQEAPQNGEITTGEDNGADGGDNGSSQPNSDNNSNEGGPPKGEGGAENGSIQIGKGNYAKGKQTRKEKKANKLQNKAQKIDDKSKSDVKDQETKAKEDKKDSKEKGKKKKGKQKEEKGKLKKKLKGKKKKRKDENKKVAKKGKDNQGAKGKKGTSKGQKSGGTMAKKAGKSTAKAAGKKGGQNYVVDKESSQLFSGSQIIKKTDEGNAVVFGGSGLSEEQKAVAKPLPQNIMQNELEKRKQTNSAYIETFNAQSQSQIAKLKTDAAQQKTKLNVKQTIVLGEIETATNSALEKVESALSAAKEEISAKYSSYKQSVQTHAQTVIESINTKKEAEKANIDTELSTAQESCKTLEETTITKAQTSIDTQANRIKETAKRLGDVAESMANARAEREKQAVVKEQSGWEDFKNGGDYQENKKKARIEACYQVGRETKKQFLESAENASAELLKSKSAIAEEITANVAQLTEAFGTKADEAKTAVDTKSGEKVEAVNAESESLAQELESKKASELEALSSFGTSKKSEIRKLSSQLKSQLNQQVVSAKQQIEQTTSSSIGQLSSTQSELVASLQSGLEMAESDFQKLFNKLSQKFQSASQGIASSISNVGSSSYESIGSFGSGAVEKLNSLSSSSLQSINSQKQQALSTGEGIKSGAIASLDGLKSQSEAELAGIASNFKTFINSKVTEFTNKFEQAAADIDADVTCKADEAIAGFQNEISNLPQVLTDKANEAEAAVQPRWRKIVGVLIEIVAAVALAAVVALLVASGVGIIGLLIGGAIAGALLGAGKQMLNNAIDGKPVMEGVGRAAVLGAIEGTFAALTGGAGAKIVAKLGATAVKLGEKAVVKAAGEVLTEIAEGAITTIAENIMDGKSWNEGLIQSVSSGAIDSVVGMGTGKISDKIQGSKVLGSQIGESATKRASRQALDFSVDFAGSSLTSGAQNVITKWDQIQAGEAGFMDTFGEGVKSDLETNLAQSATRNAAGTVTDRIFEHAANKRVANGKGGGDVVPEGYKRTLSETGDNVELRATTTFNEDGREHADLTYDASGEVVRKDPTTDTRSPDEIVNALDPSGHLSADDRGKIENWANQGKHDKIKEFEEANSDLTLSSQRSAKEKIVPEAINQGLPSEMDGYTYHRDENGDLDVSRNKQENKNGKPLPQLGVEGDKIVRTGEHVETRSKQEYLEDIDPSQKLPKNVRGELYNYARQGKQDKVDQILQRYDSDLVRSRRVANNPSESATIAANRGLPEAPDGYHYSQANGKLIIKRTRVKDSQGNTRPKLIIDGGRLRYADESKQGKHPEVDKQMEFDPFMSDTENNFDPKENTRTDAWTRSILSRNLGLEGENAVGAKGKVNIPSLTGSAKYRIPDGLTSTELIEVKNVGNLSYTKQLQDFNLHAQKNGLVFYLYTRPDTKISEPLLKEIKNGNIVLRNIPN